MVAMVTKIVFFNIFLLIMIGLDYTVIMMYYMPYYMLPFMHGSSKTFKIEQIRPLWREKFTATLAINIHLNSLRPFS